MKKLSLLLSLCALAAVLLTTAGCVQDQPRRSVHGSRKVPRSPYIGSPEWITWVDHRVDTRYANGIRPDPGSREWYAIVDHVVFSDHSRDYYRNRYSNEYRDEYRRYYGTRADYRVRHNYADNYYGPARFESRDGSNRGDYGRDRLGSIEWKRAVDARILSGRVPKPPPLSDPWDTPLGTTSDR